MDPIHDLKPVKMMQALQGNIAALQSHAAKIIRNERTARIQDSDACFNLSWTKEAEKTCGH